MNDILTKDHIKASIKNTYRLYNLYQQICNITKKSLKPQLYFPIVAGKIEYEIYKIINR
ncbi:MAG: hypothetical protein FWG98_05600 [Candidatus Cloacimonetes bacterium]|nr:hypothetical protein [Candidatus Cloacimonadota bacterium]